MIGMKVSAAMPSARTVRLRSCGKSEAATSPMHMGAGLVADAGHGEWPSTPAR